MQLDGYGWGRLPSSFELLFSVASNTCAAQAGRQPTGLGHVREKRRTGTLQRCSRWGGTSLLHCLHYPSSTCWEEGSTRCNKRVILIALL